MIAVVSGIYEDNVVQVNEGRASTSIIVNQLGEEEKCRIKVADGFKFPPAGSEITVKVAIRKGVFNGRPYVSIKAVQ